MFHLDLARNQISFLQDKIFLSQQNLVNLLGKGSVLDFEVLKEYEDAEDWGHETKVEAAKELKIENVQPVQKVVRSERHKVFRLRSKMCGINSNDK